VAEAEAALAQANASLAASQTLANRSVVRAAFDGIVAKRFHNPGDLVEASSGDPVLRVIDPARLEVVASVPLADAPRITIGAPARLSGTPLSASESALHVLSRPAAVDPGTATVPVRLGFAGETNLPAGAPVAVDIQAEQHDAALLVPAAAIVREGDETAVFVASGGKAERRPVEIGLSEGAQDEVVSGLHEGEMVIVDGQAGLPDGAAISVGGAEEGAAR
jgi:RND family efflux transporter MFP subunit